MAILASRSRSQPSDQRGITSIDDGESHTSRTHPLQTPNGVSAPIMKISTLLLLTLASITGCSMTHGDPTHPKKNPHPVKRYEITATADAPGPWDSVSGTVFFDVINADCVPQGSFTGGRNIPNISHEFKMTHVSEKTWRGHFHRDLLQDEDYFGNGICHWDATGMGPVFVVHGATFSPTRGMEQAIQSGSYTEYFKKSTYKDHAFTGMSALEFLPNSPEVAKHPEDFFPITITIKEVEP